MYSYVHMYFSRLYGFFFRGIRCTSRCKNSLDILQRQPKAIHLSQCKCSIGETLDGEFACSDVKSNSAKLCMKNRDKEKSEVNKDNVQVVVNEEDEEDEEDEDVENEVSLASSSSWSIFYLVLSAAVAQESLLILF